jgi:cytochrome c biogenesis protein CcmG/thiol:disulfide interchange protein DsbE
VSGPQRRLAAILVGAAVVAVAAVVLATPLGRAPVGSPEASSVVVGGSPLLGKPLPHLVLEDLDGATVDTAQLLGRPLVVNVWASWCVPCRDEFPLLVGAYGEYRDRDLAVLGIVRRDSAESARAFATAQGATWPMLLDPDETAYHALIGIGVPQTYFVDPDGIVRWVNLGPFSADGLAYGISRILPTSSAPPAGSPGAS